MHHSSENGKMFAKYYNLFNWADRVYRDRYRGGAHPGAPLIFRPNWGPKGKKKCFRDCPAPPIKGSGWLGAPLISRSRSGTVKEATFRVQHFVIHINAIMWCITAVSTIRVCAVDCKTGVSWWLLKVCLGSIHVFVYIWLNPCLLGPSGWDTTQ